MLARVVPDTKSGTPGANAVKVKGTITWVGVDDGLPAEVRLYDRLFADEHPDTGGRDLMESLNPRSKPKTASRSSATATSSPIASITAPVGRSSTASPA